MPLAANRRCVVSGRSAKELRLAWSTASMAGLQPSPTASGSAGWRPGAAAAAAPAAVTAPRMAIDSEEQLDAELAVPREVRLPHHRPIDRTEKRIGRIVLVLPL